MNLKKEFPYIILMALPFIYLAYIWNTLPETVPTHWNASGEIDGYGSKNTLLIIPFMLPVLVYIIMTIAPKIDSKNKIATMGKKYEQLKFFLVLFMSVLALFIIYSSKTQSFSSPNIIYILLGLLFAGLGNFMKTVKPNYFIGIKTPWTLENETVWKKTHLLGGKIWFVGGLLIVCMSLIFTAQTAATLFVIIAVLITIIPLVHSYIEFKKIK
ncbi:SdpI family protein [Olleya marilimosa]|uniref:SdpI family protein n=1 Tax=Olleya marilimosa TaxID=272164 RepID=UPI00168D6696|nr:SdpI family protein [Olleya marilimosa]MBD3891784.1 SdpI family protein [Olleya marilimosa]